jgi:hypothetical protein
VGRERLGRCGGVPARQQRQVASGAHQRVSGTQLASDRLRLGEVRRCLIQAVRSGQERTEQEERRGDPAPVVEIAPRLQGILVGLLRDPEPAQILLEAAKALQRVTLDPTQTDLTAEVA